MKKNRIGLVTAVIAAVFAAGIITFIGGIAYDRSQGPQKARKYFDSLKTETEYLLNRYDISSGQFATGFIKAIDDFSRYNKLILRTDSVMIYHYEATESDSAVSEDFSAVLTAASGVRYQLYAQMYTITPLTIYYRARVSFLLILAGTVAAILLILFINFDDSESTSDYFGDDISVSNYDREPDSSTEELSETNESTVQTSESLTAPVGDKTESDYNSENTPAEQAPVQYEELTEDNVLNEWLLSQQRLESDLEAELIHSASSAKDVSLLMFKFTASTVLDKDLLAQVLEMIARKTQDRGYFYNYNDGYALILQEASLDVAMELAEEIHTEAQAILSQCKNAHLLIGISARTERIIAAKRLLTEAEQAVEHASDDPDSPIIAFRVNPEKYRQYILNNEI